MDLNDEDDDDS